MDEKSNKDTLVINKKILRGVAPAIAIIAILISKDQPGPLILFLTGIAVGVIIGVYWKAPAK